MTCEASEVWLVICYFYLIKHVNSTKINTQYVNNAIVYCMVHVLSCVGIVATVWLRMTVPFSIVLTQEALLA